MVTEMAQSKTVEIFSKVTDMKSRGEIVNGALCVGQPDFAPPPEVMEATSEACVLGKTNYTSVSGTLELRQAICQYLEVRKKARYTPDEILVTAGGKQGIYEVVLALCQAGDEVIVPAPYWTSYPDIVKMAGSTPVILETKPEQGYAIDPEAFAKAIKPNTRMLIMCNPSNPTGCIMDKSQVEALADVLKRPENQHVFVLSDEIYERLCYDGVEHVSMAAIDGMWDRTLTINGFSKAFSMTGYRLGYLAAPAEIVKAAAKLQGQITSCAASLSQHAGVAALKGPAGYIDSKVVELQSKRDKALQLVLNIDRVTCPKPSGAFYLLPDISAYFGSKTQSGEVIADANAFCLHLLAEYKVALVPGEAFGAPRCLRLSYAATMADIEDAVGKMKACLLNLIAPEEEGVLSVKDP